MASEFNESDLRQEIDRLRSENQSLKGEIAELQRLVPSKSPVPEGEPDERSIRAVEPAEVTPISDADAALRRIIQRIAMILQSEKVVIMFYDPETGELRGIPPSYGVDEDRLKMFRMRATQGLSGEVFRDMRPAIFLDAATDARTAKDPFGILGVQNGITVPLVIEKRDEENRVIERNVIGVLHAFNKSHGGDFFDEDVRLLERLSKNVGSIISNLQLYREVIEEREELLQTFESLAAGLMLVSPEGTVSQINTAARAIFNVGPEVLGKPVEQVADIDNLLEMFHSAQTGAEVPVVEISVTIANAERHYQVQGAQVKGEDNRSLGVVAIFMDITEIKNIERMKSAFVAMASHELRTPLTAIKGFVSTLLLDATFTPEEQREFLMIIDTECDRLTRLINDLLNTARIEAGESLKPSYTMVDFRSLMEKVVSIQKQATSKHELVLEAPDTLPEIVGDEDKLDQVLTNLMNNAIKYSPGGGTITLHCELNGDELVVGVRDQGLGIPKDHLGKVFEKFHRVNNEDNRKIYGTGLGLFLVKHLVEDVHLGKIWAESEVGKGSDFIFRIPTNLDIEEAKARNQ